ARGDTAAPRFGFTASKKVGSAVERNRVRRRLREIVRRHAALLPETGHDYVLIGRRTALQAPFDLMVAEFTGALTRLRGQAERTSSTTRPPSPPSCCRRPCCWGGNTSSECRRWRSSGRRRCSSSSSSSRH